MGETDESVEVKAASDAIEENPRGKLPVLTLRRACTTHGLGARLRIFRPAFRLCAAAPRIARKCNDGLHAVYDWQTGLEWLKFQSVDSGGASVNEKYLSRKLGRVGDLVKVFYRRE